MNGGADLGFRIADEHGKYTKSPQLLHSPGAIRGVDVNKTSELQRDPDEVLFTKSCPGIDLQLKICLQNERQRRGSLLAAVKRCIRKCMITSCRKA